MSVLIDFLTSYFFITVIVAWLSSVFLKWAINRIIGNRHSFKEAFANGGMPSSHSAFVASFAAAIYLVEGLSSVFFLSLMIAVIVMSDAFRVRKNLGIQGDSLNKLLVKLKQNPIQVVHGHFFFQVIMGALWGILVAVGLFYLI